MIKRSIVQACRKIREKAISLLTLLKDNAANWLIMEIAKACGEIGETAIPLLKGVLENNPEEDVKMEIAKIYLGTEAPTHSGANGSHQ